MTEIEGQSTLDHMAGIRCKDNTYLPICLCGWKGELLEGKRHILAFENALFDVRDHIISTLKAEQ